LDAINKGIDAYFNEPERRQRIKRSFADKSRLAEVVAADGMKPERMFELLDLRGREGLYPSAK